MSQAKLNAKLDALSTMSPAQLREAWKALSGENLQSTPASLLRYLIAYRLQEKRYGKLPVQIERQLDRMSGGRGQGDKGTVVAGTGSGSGSGFLEPRSSIPFGTRILREWNGKTISVTAVEGGFDWEGQVYRSLSEIARRVTGAHWSGPRFFGLKRVQI